MSTQHAYSKQSPPIWLQLTAGDKGSSGSDHWDESEEKQRKWISKAIAMKRGSLADAVYGDD